MSVILCFWNSYDLGKWWWILSPEGSYFFSGMTDNFGDVFQSVVSHCLDIEGWISVESEGLWVIPVLTYICTVIIFSWLLMTAKPERERQNLKHYSFNKPGIVLGFGDGALKKVDTVPAHMGLTFNLSGQWIYKFGDYDCTLLIKLPVVKDPFVLPTSQSSG